MPARPPAWPSFALNSVCNGDGLVIKTMIGIHSIPTLNGNFFLFHFIMIDLGNSYKSSLYPMKINSVNKFTIEDLNILGSRPMYLMIEYTSKSSLIAQVAGNATMGPTFRNECGGVETPAKEYEPRKPRKRPKEMSHFNFLGVRKSKRQRSEERRVGKECRL